MKTFSELMDESLNDRYAEVRQELADGICNVFPNPLIEYSRRVGYLAALKDVRDKAKEIVRQLNGEVSNVSK